MNDFLQTLRNGPSEKQRTPMTRKNWDETFHSSSQQYQHMNRQVPNFIPPNQMNPNQMNMETSVHSPLHGAIEKLSNSLRALSQNQKILVDVQEKSADMLERQVCAIEKILDHLNISS